MFMIRKAILLLVIAGTCLGTAAAANPLPPDDYYNAVMDIYDNYTVEPIPDLKLSIGSKKYMVGNREFESDTAPTVINDRTYIPIRNMADAFGASIEYDSGKIVVNIGNVQAEFSVGNNRLNISFLSGDYENYSLNMDAAAVIDENNRCLLSVRIAAEEIFGCGVTWNQTDNSVIISHDYQSKRLIFIADNASFEKYKAAECIYDKWGNGILQFDMATPDIIVKKICEQIAADDNVQYVSPDKIVKINF